MIKKEVGYYDLATGEPIEEKVFKAIKSEEYGNRVKDIFNKIGKFDFDNLDLEEMEIALKIIGLEREEIHLDYIKNKEAFFIIKDNTKITDSLDLQVRGCLYSLIQKITHDNILITRNRKPIVSFSKLREELNATEWVWKNTIMPEIHRLNIIKKEKINNGMCLVLNPLYSIKSRRITEYTFRCFHDELSKYIHPLHYVLLSKMYGVNPDKIIDRWKNVKNDTQTIDLSKDMAIM